MKIRALMFDSAHSRPERLKFTPYDVLVFAFRDNYPDKWAEADDFAAVVIADLQTHGFTITQVSAHSRRGDNQ